MDMMNADTEVHVCIRRLRRSRCHECRSEKESAAGSMCIQKSIEVDGGRWVHALDPTQNGRKACPKKVVVRFKTNDHSVRVRLAPVDSSHDDHPNFLLDVDFAHLLAPMLKNLPPSLRIFKNKSEDREAVPPSSAIASPPAPP
jgi:hypothetical protein